MGEFPNRSTQFKPGQSGNPRGLKPGTKTRRSIKKRLHALLDAMPQEVLSAKVREKLNINIEGLDNEDIMHAVHIINAMKGDSRSYSILLDRLEGRPESIHHLSHSGSIKTISVFDPDGKIIAKGDE